MKTKIIEILVFSLRAEYTSDKQRRFYNLCSEPNIYFWQNLGFLTDLKMYANSSDIDEYIDL